MHSLLAPGGLLFHDVDGGGVVACAAAGLSSFTGVLAGITQGDLGLLPLPSSVTRGWMVHHRLLTFSIFAFVLDRSIVSNSMTQIFRQIGPRGRDEAARWQQQRITRACEHHRCSYLDSRRIIRLRQSDADPVGDKEILLFLHTL